MERTCIAITSSDKDAVIHLEIYTPEDKSNLKGMIQIYMPWNDRICMEI